MVDITILVGVCFMVYKPTNITMRPHPVVYPNIPGMFDLRHQGMLNTMAVDVATWDGIYQIRTANGACGVLFLWIPRKKPKKTWKTSIS
jgi:hypothetical protein